MTALHLAGVLRILFIIASGVVAVGVLAVQAVLHWHLDRPGFRTVPNNFWRALKLSFGIAVAVFVLSLFFPVEDLAGTPPAMVAMLLCGIGALVTAAFFVLAAWEFIITSYRRSRADHLSHPKQNGHGSDPELWTVPDVKAPHRQPTRH